MHQTIYGTLNLNQDFQILQNDDKTKVLGDFQPLCTYHTHGTLFSIGGQFQGAKTENGFLIETMALKMYCFYGAITIGFVSGSTFQFSNYEDEHVLTINVQALNTSGQRIWPDSTSPQWKISSNSDGFLLEDGKILRTEIKINPVVIDETKSAQEYEFIDDYLYIRDGEEIKNKKAFTDAVQNMINIINNNAFVSPMFHMDEFSNYFLGTRNRNCYQRDTRIKIL